MAQIKIYGHAAFVEANRAPISDAVHACVMEALDFPPDKRFQRFFPMQGENFIYPDDRSDQYLIIEISLFEGRSSEAKKQLIRLLFATLASAVGLAPQDLEITLYETPKANWGIRGQPGDELALNYKVEV